MGLSPVLTIIIVLSVGALVGFINGYAIVKIGMNPFLSTLGMRMMLRGVTLIMSSGQTLYGLPGAFRVFGAGTLGPIPVPVILMLACYAIAFTVLQHRKFGRELYAVGGNKAAAVASGIDADKVGIMGYMMCSVMAAIAGIMLAGRLNSAQAIAGEGMELLTIASSVIGGISLAGGSGSIIGTLGGTLLMGIIDNGLNLLNVSSFWIEFSKGFIIFTAVFIDTMRDRLFSKKK